MSGRTRMGINNSLGFRIVLQEQFVSLSSLSGHLVNYYENSIVLVCWLLVYKLGGGWVYEESSQQSDNYIINEAPARNVCGLLWIYDESFTHTEVDANYRRHAKRMINQRFRIKSRVLAFKFAFNGVLGMVFYTLAECKEGPISLLRWKSSKVP